MSTTTPAKRFTLSEQEFATAVGLSLSRVKALRLQGRVPHSRVGKRVLYTCDNISQFLELHHKPAEGG